MTVNIPEPMTAPIPSEVRLTQPRDFLSRFSGFSESEMSLSMFFFRKSCGSNRHLPRATDKKLYLARRSGATVDSSVETTGKSSPDPESRTGLRSRLRTPAWREAPPGETSAGRRSALRQPEIGVALYQFLGTVVLEADGDPAVVSFTFDADDGADAVLGMPDARTDEG